MYFKKMFTRTEYFKYLIFITTALWTCFSFADEIPTLIVSGSATLSQIADQVSLTLGVVTEDKKADVANTVNALKMQQILAALKKAGFHDKEIQTAQYIISPKYLQRPQNSNSDRELEIIGYEVRNNIHLKTDRIDSLSEILTSVVENGANTIDHIQFSLKDSEELQNRAIVKAIEQATTRAKVAAIASKTEIKQIKQITVQTPSPSLRFYKRAQMTLSVSPESPIEPGEVDVEAFVTIEFAILS